MSHRTNIFEPISLSKIRMSAGPADESFGDEITYRQGVPISIFRESIELGRAAVRVRSKSSCRQRYELDFTDLNSA